MSWNHRAVRKKLSNGKYVYAIHEVYYHYDKVWSMTQDPVGVSCFPDEEDDPIKMLKQTLEWMLNGLKGPVLEWDEENKEFIEVDER